MNVAFVISAFVFCQALAPDPKKAPENPLLGRSFTNGTIRIGTFSSNIFVAEHVITNSIVVSNFVKELKTFKVVEAKYVPYDDRSKTYVVLHPNGQPFCALWFPNFTVPNGIKPSSVVVSSEGRLLRGDPLLGPGFFLEPNFSANVWESIKAGRQGESTVTRP